MKSSIYLTNVSFEGTILGRKLMGILKVLGKNGGNTKGCREHGLSFQIHIRSLIFSLVYKYVPHSHEHFSKPHMGYMWVNNLFVVFFMLL